jgi:hypothetical protein
VILFAAAAALAASASQVLPDRAAAATIGVQSRPESTSTALNRSAATLDWGGYSNGAIPESALTYVPVLTGHPALRSDAANAYYAMSDSFQQAFGSVLIVREAYRDLARQQELYDGWIAGKPGYNRAALPGTSLHGWAIAVDLDSNVNNAGSPQKQWMDANGPGFGWQPRGNGFSPAEPWHFEYDGTYVPTEPAPEPQPEPEPVEELSDMKLITRNGSYWLIGEFTSQVIDASFLAELKTRFGVSANLGTLVAALKKQYGEAVEFTGADSVEVLTRVANYNRLELIARIQGK